jgi:polar amino acid transport system substrate-binding protein
MQRARIEWLHGVLALASLAWIAGCAPLPAPVEPAAVAALAPLGKLRVAVYPGSPTSLVRDPATGDTKGVGLDLGRAMASRLGVPFELAEFPNNAEALAAVKAARADFAFTNATPARRQDMDFSPPLIAIEQGYLAAPGATLVNAGAVDRPGVRIGVAKASSSERELTGLLKSATVVPVASLKEARDWLGGGKLDAFASNKGILHEMADNVPGSRLLEGRYGLESFAIGVPKGREAGHAWLRSFATGARADGTVQRAAARAGLRGTSDPQ